MKQHNTCYTPLHNFHFSLDERQRDYSIVALKVRDSLTLPQGKQTKVRWGRAERELMYKYLNGKGQVRMDPERFMNSQEYRHEFWELESKFRRHPKKNFTQNSMRCVNTWRAEQVQREARRAATDGVDEEDDEDDEYSSDEEKKDVACKLTMILQFLTATHSPHRWLLSLSFQLTTRTITRRLPIRSPLRHATGLTIRWKKTLPSSL